MTEVNISGSAAEQEKLIVSVNKSQSTADGSSLQHSAFTSDHTDSATKEAQAIAPYERTTAGVMPFSEDAEPASLKNDCE